MNQFRINLAKKVFKSIDTKGAGRISIDEFKDIYCAGRHPDVLVRKRTEEEVLTEFLDTFDEYCNFVVLLFKRNTERR